MSLQSQLDINQDNNVAAVSSPVRLAEELALVFGDLAPETSVVQSDKETRNKPPTKELSVMIL